jgi:hypothetical protein
MVVGPHHAAGEQEQSQGETKMRLESMQPVLAIPAILAILTVFPHDQAPPSFFRLTSCPSSNESAGFITI